MAVDLLTLRQNCETWLREGRSTLAAHSLRQLNLNNLARADRLPLANLSRRAGLHKLGLKILSPVVNNNDHGYQKDVSSEEWIEYAALLLRIGSIDEGLAILTQIDSQMHPEALLVQAFGLFNQWKYEQAVPLLKLYIENPATSIYQRRIGRVNLASAYLGNGDLEAAKFEIAELKDKLRQAGSQRLFANCLEMEAQIELQSEHLTSAETLLTAAHAILKDEISFEELFLQKWRAVLASQKTRDESPLLELRQKAQSRRHWESIRDTDYHRLRIFKNEDLFRYIYFGTPHESYRERLQQLVPDFSCGDKFNLGEGEQEFDLSSGTLAGQEVMSGGKKMHQLLVFLIADFYRPRELGALFARIFPDEKLNIFSAPLKIHQLMHRTRKCLADNHIHLFVSENSGAYHFSLEPGTKIIISESPNFSGTEDFGMNRLQNIYGANSFSAREAGERMRLPATTLARILKFGIESRIIVKVGNGRQTRYEFASKETSLGRDRLRNSS